MIEQIAKKMSQKYKDNEAKWLLDLKRLEANGYQISKVKYPFKEEPTLHTCEKCGNKILPDYNGQILQYHGKYFCHHCALSLILEDNKPMRILTAEDFE